MEPLTSTACRSCRLRLLSKPASRTFSTSRPRCSIPPESPHYVDVPPSHQANLPWTPAPKGILPVPRELFPKKRPDKPSAQYIENVTREPLPHNVVPEQALTEKKRYRARMTELRKQQLRQGLTQLHARKQAETALREKKRELNRLERERLTSQAQREDERLTSASTPSEMKPGKQNDLASLQADLAAAKRQHAQKVANYARTSGAKTGERMDSLHTLYMHARSFITTEEQLSQKIGEAFDTDPETDPTRRKTMHADFQSSVKRGDSMWNFGPPDSIKDMIADASNRARQSDQMRIISGFGAASALARQYKNQDAMSESRFRKEQDRLKRIAEKLSGGKI